MKNILCSALLCSALLLDNSAQAAVLTFDDISTSNYGTIANGYGGLNWSNMGYTNGFNPNSGYFNGRVSGDYVAFNEWENMAVVSNTDFTFNGAYFTAAWNDGLTVLAKGFKNNVELFSQSFIINTSGSSWLAFNFLNIDELRLSSSGGIANPSMALIGAGTHFAMDNFTFNESTNAVPVPAAVWLFGSGLMGLLGFNRRKQLAQAIAA